MMEHLHIRNSNRKAYMLIEKANYKRNKYGDIIKRQEVEIKCDRCGLLWTTKYDYRKRKKYDEDLCKSCRSKANIKRQSPLAIRRWSKSDCDHQKVCCDFCGRHFDRYPSAINDRNFCNLECRDGHILRSRYSHLYDIFENNIDAVSYLIGVILGDGHLRKIGKETTRVDVAFDSHEEQNWIYNIFLEVITPLGINFFEESSAQSNCRRIGFILPDSLLDRYGMLFSGVKFNAQPRPNNDIINNVNFAAGLINSDGYFRWNKSGKYYYESISFCNTTESIKSSFIECLIANDIEFSQHNIFPKADKRTGKISKPYWKICLNKQKSIKLLRGKSRYEIKYYSRPRNN